MEINIPTDVKFGWFVTQQMRKLPKGGSAVLKFVANEENRKKAKSYMANKRGRYYAERLGVFKLNLSIELIEGEITVRRVE